MWVTRAFVHLAFAPARPNAKSQTHKSPERYTQQKYEY